MKNKEPIDILKKYELDTNVEATLKFVKRGLSETTYHSGKWMDVDFTMEARTNWRTATMKLHTTVEDLIEVLENKELGEISSEDFPDIELWETYDGGTDFISLDWDTPLTEEIEDEVDNWELYHNSDINDCEYHFCKGCIDSMEILVGDDIIYLG